MSNLSIHTDRASYSYVPFVHTITSKKTNSKEILIITGYDYFLQKRDLKKILQNYVKVILIPRSVTDAYYLGSEVGKYIEDSQYIHLINNPNYDFHHRVIYTLAINNNKTIRTTIVSDFCEKYLKKIYIPESIEDSHEVELSLKYFPLSIRIVKKAADWIGGVTLLGVTLPFWALAYIRIKSQSPGPAFYKQLRVGIREEEFECVKFRSMRTDAESNGAQFASKNDDRVFPFGKVMRVTRIDELPQLLNLIRGEMSLVGPRPERKVFTDAFDENIPHYKSRHVVKPGISGYAQVMYPYGIGVKDARHKLMYDLYYIKNWSLGLEIEIIIRTIATILLKRGI